MASPIVASGNPAGQPLVLSRFGYLTPKSAAEFTGISYQELERLRREGGGPRFCFAGSRLIRYAVEDLCGWLGSFKVSNTAEAAALAKSREVASA